MKKLLVVFLVLMMAGVSFAGSSRFSTIRYTGTSTTVGSETVTVFQRDDNNDILFATGTTVPTDATSGYAKGAVFLDTDVSTGTSGLYQNVGTNTSCNFDVVLASDAGTIALSQIVGGSDTQLLIAGSDGTLAYKTLSGDATITNAGVITIGNNKIGTAELNINTVTVDVQSGQTSGTATVTSGSTVIGDAIPFANINDSTKDFANKVSISGTTLTVQTIGAASMALRFKVSVLEP